MIQSEPVYRIQARRGGKSVHEARSKDRLQATLAFEELRRANAVVNAYDNLELQIRDAGAARFRPLMQAVGSQVIRWGFE